METKESTDKNIILTILRLFGLILTFLSGSGLCQIFFTTTVYMLPQGAGGIIGTSISNVSITYFNAPGAILLLFAIFLVGLTLYSGEAWLRIIIKFSKYVIHKIYFIFCVFCRYMKNSYYRVLEWNYIRKEEKKARLKSKPIAKKRKSRLLDVDMNSKEAPALNTNLTLAMHERDLDDSNDEILDSSSKFLNKATISNGSYIEAAVSKKTIKNANKSQLKNGLPGLDLLDDAGAKPETMSTDTLEQLAALVEEKLSDFGIKANVVEVHPGPVVTRLEINLAPGIKVSKLTTLSQDLARSLSTSRVRIVEVIPGKPYVGIELPNENREMVRIKEILSHPKFINSKTPLTIALGKDISGCPEVANIGKMPHLLVAGTTGSGKSVGINAMIISMLYKAGPENLRMIMIDPKMLELSVYEGIPHLLTPVVTDMKEAANSLRWCVKEMDRRYALMAALGVRNIAGLNDKIKAAKESGEAIKDPIWEKLHPGKEDIPELVTMPYIVVVSDEFADMIMVVGKKVEELIARLAQKARAAGIHLILATQRPSVDVVTGLIKANIPTRISFQVSSRIDSRTIIDQQGAEQLLGHGDMLYLPPGSGTPVRVHGAFVDDDEVHRVVAAWKDIGGSPDYIDSILNTENLEDEVSGGDQDADRDALYDDALKIVLESQRASISNVQRRLRIGYNRAARLIEDMEKSGVVSEMQSNGMREVLIRRKS